MQVFGLGIFSLTDVRFDWERDSMDAFELNKIAGSVLAALLVLFGAKTVSNFVFVQHPPEKPGYAIEVAKKTESGSGEKKSAAQVAPIAVRLAKADATRGESVAKKCMACHSFTKNGKNGVGPNLWNIVLREVGAVKEYSYSQAIRALGGKWEYAALDQFIANPKKVVPNTKMAFAGVANPEQRADLILYLHSLSENPHPLPIATDAKPGKASSRSTGSNTSTQ